MIFWKLIYFLMFLIFYANGHYNLLIGRDEVKRLLGVSSSELYYVRNGVVNTYAMNFEVPVPANVSQLEFLWQSLTRHPLPYVLTAEYNNRIALKKPTFNITREGILPNRMSTFHLNLECTGDVTAEVKIYLQFNISSTNQRHNNTSLNFKRNKICVKNLNTVTTTTPVITTSEINEITTNTNNNELSNEIITIEKIKNNDPKSTNGTSGRVTSETVTYPNIWFYIALGSSCGVIVMALLVIFNSSFVYTYFGFNKLSMSRNSQRSDYTCAEYGVNNNANVFVRLKSSRCGSYATISSVHKYSPAHSFVSPYATSYIGAGATTTLLSSQEHIYSKPETSSKVSYYASSQLINISGNILKDPRESDVEDRLEQLYVPREAILIEKVVQEGAFGRVYKGILRSRSSDKLQQVLIKTTTGEASDEQIETLFCEGVMMFELKHVNILSIIATNNDSAPLLVYPFVSRGNLKKYLQNCRLRDGDQFTLITQDQISIAIQVAIAGVFLHTNGYYHKDIATRNCVIDDDLRVKIADSALSRDLFPNDYHCLGDNDNRPIKWLALESFASKKYSGPSDVWSFGVLIWELMTLAHQPYEEIDPYEMELYLNDGYRLAQPLNCPDDLFGMMTCCWLPNPDERPTFIQLLACLQDFQTALNRFI